MIRCFQLDSSEVTLKPFFNRRLELSTQDGVLLWGNRVVVPPPGRDLILQELHACHRGTARMKTLARMFVWWPCLDKDIEQFVYACSVCQSQRPAPPPVPIRPWSWPTTPWSRLHLDLAGPFLGHMFLVLMDAHSKWLEVRILSSTTSSVIVSTLRSIFAQFGLPSIIVSNNGRYFTSSEFQQFLCQNGIKHFLSSPYHPSSNGLAERGVQIFKKEMAKFKEGSLADRLSHILFYNHITPQTTTGLMPAELLQNRRLRSRLDLIKPDLQSHIGRKQYDQQRFSNILSRDRHFSTDEAVYVHNFAKGEKWIAGKILKNIGEVSYEVILDDGRHFRRHVDHIRKRYDQEPTPGGPIVCPSLFESSTTVPTDSSVALTTLSPSESSPNFSSELTKSSTTPSSDSTTTEPPSDSLVIPPSPSASPRYPKRSIRPPEF